MLERALQPCRMNLLFLESAQQVQRIVGNRPHHVERRSDDHRYSFSVHMRLRQELRY